MVADVMTHLWCVTDVIPHQNHVSDAQEVGHDVRDHFQVVHDFSDQIHGPPRHTTNPTAGGRKKESLGDHQIPPPFRGGITNFTFCHVGFQIQILFIISSSMFSAPSAQLKAIHIKSGCGQNNSISQFGIN